VVTEGVLTRMLQSDPGLDGVAAILFDEFHERSLQADLGLAMVLDARATLGLDLRIVAMSATLDGAAVAALLADAAGPYFTQGQTWEHVQATAYPPEEAGADVQWRALPPTNANEPWVFDLTPLDKATDRCVYVRCAVWTASAGPARLDVGSDDGVKVWLNGALVHEFKGSRSHTPLQDQVPVQLVGGWNTLLLKVVQISGQWGFSCAVRGTDGEALPEIKFQAEVPVSQ